MTGSLPIGTVLAGRYQIERELGHGAMGAVYVARDLKHQREVAVKVLAAEATRAVEAERFLAEVRTAARLNHPHILSVHDSGQEAGVLYYVMPRVEGESLRDLLDREPRLRVSQALSVARQAASGLAHAHARGVVHRDIKPDNILLDPSGHVYLADFGLALAFSSVAGTRRTAPGVALGSPLYMSPEQASGERDVDARTDIYSLGCVLFEMLVGEAPFEGEGAREVLLRHLTQPPPRLRSRRADIPPGLERAVCKALAKEPEERYATAEAFGRALELDREPSVAGRSSDRPGAGRIWLRVGLGAAIAAFLVAAVLVGRPMVSPLLGGAELDTSRYAILPFQRGAGVPERLRPDLQLQEALEHWRELALVSRLQVGDAVERAGGASLSGREAREVARRLGAGRYIFGQVSLVGDSTQLDAVLLDASHDGGELQRASRRMPLGEVLPANAVADLADALLFGRAGDAVVIGRPGTNSMAARQAFAAGQAAVEQWSLWQADSLFSAAVREDPGFARAQLWLAQVRNWSGAAPTTWVLPAERALRDPAELPEHERSMAEALALLGRGDYPEACELYGRLLEEGEARFAAWYGLGECRRLDDAVVADPESPSGWRFRSSYHEAVESYRRAFETLPLTHRGGTIERLTVFFYTQPNRPRWGRGLYADSLRFLALPALRRDTLAFVPYPDPWPVSRWRQVRADPATSAALLHQRRLVEDIALHWSAAFPNSPEALEALGLSQVMLGDPAGRQTLRRAWQRSTDPQRRLRLMAAEVWARVKFGVPDDSRDLITARRLARSVLEEAERLQRRPASLASLALLIGDPGRAARYARQDAEAGDWLVIRAPASLVATGAALAVFAAAGGPTDSLSALERATERGVQNLIPADRRDGARHHLLERPATLAMPVYRSRLFDGGFGFDAAPAAAYQIAARGDTAAALERLTSTPLPGASPAVGSSFDMLYPEAWLIAALGRPEIAAARLDAAFETLRWTQPDTFEDPANVGGLLRAIGLRTALARHAGDQQGARRWERALSTLWADAPLELRMAALRAPVPLPQ